MAGITGDKPRKDWDTLAASVELPVLIDADGIVGTNTLKKQDHAINQAAYGKKRGAAVIVMKADGSVGGIAVAMGAGKTAKWGVAEFAAAKDVQPA